MNENEEMQAVDQENLQNVAGGNQGDINRIKRDVQMATVSEAEKKEIDSLLNSYMMEQMINQERVSPRALYAGPDRLRGIGEERRRRELRMKTLTDKLGVFAGKYPNYPGLEQFVKQNK